MKLTPVHGIFMDRCVLRYVALSVDGKVGETMDEKRATGRAPGVGESSAKSDGEIVLHLVDIASDDALSVVRRIRGLLKRALRDYGFRCTSVEW